MIQKKVIVADDHDIYNLGLKITLEKDPFFRVIGEAVTGENALKLIAEKDCDLVICDYLLPKMNGLTVLIEAKKIKPYIKTILTSSIEKYELQSLCVKNKIDAYLFKSEARIKITEVANLIFRNQLYHSFQKSESDANELLTKLTKKEIETLKYWANGKTLGESGSQMKINVKTVETHRTNIKKKLNGLSKEQIFTLIKNYQDIT